MGTSANIPSDISLNEAWSGPQPDRITIPGASVDVNATMPPGPDGGALTPQPYVQGIGALAGGPHPPQPDPMAPLGGGQVKPSGKSFLADVLRGMSSGLMSAGHVVDKIQSNQYGTGANVISAKRQVADEQLQQQELGQKQQQIDMQKQKMGPELEMLHSQAMLYNLRATQLRAEISMMPKSLQEKFEQQTQETVTSGLANGSIRELGQGFDDEGSAQHLKMESIKNSGSPTPFIVSKMPDGKFHVYQMINPKAPNAEPMDMIVGVIPGKGKDGKPDWSNPQPVTQKVPAGTASIGDIEQHNVKVLSEAHQKFMDDALAVQSKHEADVEHQQTPAGQAEIAGERAKAGEARAETANLGAEAALKKQQFQMNANLMGSKDGFGNPIGNPGDNLKDIKGKEKSFSKNYVEPLGQLQKTKMEFDRITSDPKMNPAEKVTGLLNAVGISFDPLKGKGARMTSSVIGEHAGATDVYQSALQKIDQLRKGGGGPITEQQVRDYARVAKGVVHDAYVTAAQEARRQGLGIDFLPKATKPNQVVDEDTGQIYLDAAGGDVAKAHNALMAAGYK